MRPGSKSSRWNTLRANKQGKEAGAAVKRRLRLVSDEMGGDTMKRWLIGGALAVLFALGGGTGWAAAQPAEVPVSLTFVLGGDCDGRAAETIEVGAGSNFKVVLYAAGGTGYAWTLAESGLDGLALVEHTVGPVDPSAKLSGGRLKWSFVLQAPATSAGQTALKFALQRSWEKNTPPVRTLDLAVIVK